MITIEYRLVIIGLLLTTAMQAQVSGTVRDSLTGEPLSYVNIWVAGQNIGSTSDEEGRFELERAKVGDTIVLSAVGYASVSVAAADAKLDVSLAPAFVELEGMTVTPHRDRAKQTVGDFERKEVSFYYGCSTPWLVARYFPYDSLYASTPYFRTVHILTRSRLRHATMHVRLYEQGEDGLPGALLHDQPIVAKIKKGKRVTKVDLRREGLRVPESGFFVAVEWLILPENRYYYTYTTDDSGYEVETYNYQPTVGGILRRKPFTYTYLKGEWTATTGSAEDFKLDDFVSGKDANDLYMLPAIEVELMD